MMAVLNNHARILDFRRGRTEGASPYTYCGRQKSFFERKDLASFKICKAHQDRAQPIHLDILEIYQFCYDPSTTQLQTLMKKNDFFAAHLFEDVNAKRGRYWHHI
jgi:hypothetical protein